MYKTKIRNALLSVHRWFGLTVGALIVVTGLSGSVSVYWEDLTLAFQPRYTVKAPSGEYAPLQDVMETIYTTNPDRTDPWYLTYPYPEDIHAPVWAVYEEPAEMSHIHESPLYVALNPYTAEVLDQFYWGSTVITWIYNLHTILAIRSSDIGEPIVGIIGLVFFFISITGIYLWWPINGKFSARQFYTSPKKDGSRFEFQLHRLLGFYFSIVLLVITVTGLFITWPLESQTLVSVIQKPNAPLIEEQETGYATPISGREPINLDEAAAKAMALFPGAERRHVRIPSKGQHEAYVITMYQPEEEGFNRLYPETRVWIDQYSGEILNVSDASEFNSSRAILGYNRYTFHSGAAFGGIGEFIVFLAGLLPLLFYITGIRQWLKLRKRKVAATAASTAMN